MMIWHASRQLFGLIQTRQIANYIEYALLIDGKVDVGVSMLSLLAGCELGRILML